MLCMYLPLCTINTHGTHAIKVLYKLFRFTKTDKEKWCTFMDTDVSAEQGTFEPTKMGTVKMKWSD